MGIQNKTTLSKNLLTRFNFANLTYKLRFNLAVFPLLMLACAYVLYKEGGTMLYVYITLGVAIITPIVIFLVNFAIVQSGLKHYPAMGQTVEVKFTNEGFFVLSSENPEKCVPYAYVKECVEFRKMFIIYFKGAYPMAIEKSGFSYGDPFAFRVLMKKSINKRNKTR